MQLMLCLSLQCLWHSKTQGKTNNFKTLKWEEGSYQVWNPLVVLQALLTNSQALPPNSSVNLMSSVLWVLVCIRKYSLQLGKWVQFGNSHLVHAHILLVLRREPSEQEDSPGDTAGQVMQSKKTKIKHQENCHWLNPILSYSSSLIPRFKSY